MSNDRPEAIPPAALHALREPWRTGEDSVFDYVLTDNPERRSDPSYYHHRDRDDDTGDGLREQDAVALVRAGVFGRLSRDNGESVAINEHAEHAFVDFCSETYEAWARFKARLASLP